MPFGEAGEDPEAAGGWSEGGLVVVGPTTLETVGVPASFDWWDRHSPPDFLLAESSWDLFPAHTYDA